MQLLNTECIVNIIQHLANFKLKLSLVHNDISLLWAFNKINTISAIFVVTERNTKFLQLRSNCPNSVYESSKKSTIIIIEFVV